MTRAIVLRTAACVSACAALFACGGDAITVPPVVVDVTAKINSALSEINSSKTAAASSMSASGNPAPPAASTSEDAGVCTIDIPSKSFKCPTRTLSNGMTITASFQLLDASGTPQTSFDTLTTVAVRMVTDLSGTINQPLITPAGPVPATQTMTNHEEMTLSGIRTGPRVLNGSGTMTNSVVATGLPPATMTATNTFANLQFPQDTTKHYPIAGTISASITSQTGTEPSVTITQVTTFNGTAIGTTVITLPNGTKRTCTFDMSQPPGAAPGPPNCTNG